MSATVAHANIAPILSVYFPNSFLILFVIWMLFHLRCLLAKTARDDCSISINTSALCLREMVLLRWA